MDKAIPKVIVIIKKTYGEGIEIVSDAMIDMTIFDYDDIDALQADQRRELKRIIEDGSFCRIKGSKKTINQETKKFIRQLDEEI